MGHGDRGWVRGAALAACAAGAGLGLAPFVVDAAREAERPRLEDVEEAAGVLRGHFTAGDCALLRPAWLDFAASRLRGAGPGADAWPYPALFVAEDVDALDLLACRRIWGLVAFGGDDGLGAFTAAGAVSGGTTVTEAPGISLQRHEVARPIQVFATLSEALPGVAVRRAKAGTAGGADGVCRWTGDRHRCGREGWLDVRREARIVGHHEVFWPFVHPGPAGEVATLEWKSDAARPVGEVALVVRYGFSMEAVRRLDGGPVRLTVALGDETVGRFEVPPREWRLWRRAWPVPASGTWPAVRITVEADAPGWRELLVEAAFVDRVPGEADGVPGWVDSGP